MSQVETGQKDDSSQVFVLTTTRFNQPSPSAAALAAIFPTLTQFIMGERTLVTSEAKCTIESTGIPIQVNSQWYSNSTTYSAKNQCIIVVTIFHASNYRFSKEVNMYSYCYYLSLQLHTCPASGFSV
ncbi:hypothetical protein HOY80DRAFT_997621 [Tuber brumale]|nr:hypothetical protein HOY80DRAFT_997621 [Tuber brumale]